MAAEVRPPADGSRCKTVQLPTPRRGCPHHWTPSLQTVNIELLNVGAIIFVPFNRDVSHRETLDGPSLSHMGTLQPPPQVERVLELLGFRAVR